MALLEGQSPFFKVYHPSTEIAKALVGFELRTEPELGTGDSHSTSTLPPPHNQVCMIGHHHNDVHYANFEVYLFYITVI